VRTAFSSGDLRLSLRQPPLNTKSGFWATGEEASKATGGKRSVVMRARYSLVIAVLLLSSLSACGRTLYNFPKLSRDLPLGAVNLLSNPSFEDNVLCTKNCAVFSTWSIEYSTPGPPLAFRTRRGVVTGSFAEELVYRGQHADNGVHKAIELYQTLVEGAATSGGHRLTFTLWVSGTCVKCAPFIGIESFDTGDHYLGESDQYFDPPSTPEPVRVSYLLPSGSIAAAAYIQVPELYASSRVDLIVDDASLTSAQVPPRPTSLGL